MNPYYAYSISFTIAIAVYSLGWSDAYPPLSIPLFGFITTTVVFSILAGIYWRKNVSHKISLLSTDFNAFRVTLFIYSLWAAEFIYEGGVPLFKILLNLPYEYMLFGIPSLHVFIVTFSSFYTIYLFHLYLSTREKEILLLYLLNLSAAILIYSRAMFMFNVCASAFMYLHHAKKIPIRFLLSTPFLLILLFFLFGVFGNIRVSHHDQTPYDNTIFLNIGNANQDFRDSSIPNEFFWTYIYTSSPLANLQENINKADRHNLNWRWLLKMVNNEMLPDFVSKRINKWFDIPHPGEYRIEMYFNVYTVYSIAFSHQSWIGMVVMAFYLLAIPFIYLKFLKANSPFFSTGLAILATMYLFMAYDNTIRLTGLSFQLVYPIALKWLENKRWISIRKLQIKK